MKMYKKMMVYLIAAAMLTGCGNAAGAAGRTVNAEPGVEDVLQSQMAAENGTEDSGNDSQSDIGEDKGGEANAALGQSGVADGAPEPSTEVGDDTVLSNTEGIDIDLTDMSSNMVYAEVYGMMIEPDKFVGKTVKMDGSLSIFYDDATDKYYFACIVKDALQCCSQGIEFIPTDDFKYPDDFPGDGEDIAVQGVFTTYEEDDYTYCTLEKAKILR